MAFVINGLPSKLISSTDRLRTQNTSTAQDATLVGLSYEMLWREDVIADGTSVYAEFTIPDDMAMSLTNRVLNPSGNKFKFKAYPFGTYTIGADKVDDGDSFAFNRNKRSDISADQLCIRKTVSALPASNAFITYEDVFGSESTGNRTSGSLDSSDNFLVLNGINKFLLEMVNDGSSDMSASVKLDFILYPSESLPVITS